MTTLRRLTLAASLAARVALSLDTYDVVVVGSGPGGLLAAELLSRDAAVKVLVLEAGDVSLAATGNRKIPQWLSSARLTAWDVPGEYTHDANIFGAQNGGATIDYVDDRKLFLAQMVGGCSSVNAALYFRVPDAYVANTQWPFDAAHVNQRYDEMERDVFGWTDLPSTDGKRYLQEAYGIVSRALKRGGYSEKSINDAQARNNKPKTFGHAPFAIKNGERDSPAKTCWAKMLSRGNVKLLTGARVSYIKHSRGRATSVVYNDNVEVGVSDRGAVLMAAGAIGTPKVLIQSGIGPSDQLNGLRGNGQSKFQGIRANYGNNGDGWIVNENVGKNLFDTTLALGSFTHDQMQAFKFPTQSNGLSQMQSDYLNGRKGPLTTSGPVLVAYDNYIVQGRLYEFQLTVHATGFQDAASNDKAMGALLLINNPESRDRCSFDVNSGRYRAFTSDSLYMATGRDLAALQDFSAKIVGLMQQEGANFVKNSQQSLNDWVAGNRGAVSNHFGGTCYVSKDANDRSRCADDKLRVVGTSNIYVSDASAMRDGTVNPYGFIMYIGREVGNIVKDAIANPSPPSPPSPPQPEGGCTSFAIENGVDYSGNDLASPKSASSSGCCSLCSKQPGCGAFTWTSFEGGTCWLKSSKGKASNNGGAVSGYLQANQKKFTSCPVLETNVDYKGTDIGSATAKSADSCCSICQNKAGCGAFTWSSYQGGTCWLKSNKGSAVQSSGATSAVLQTSTCGAIEEGVDYTGKDIGNVRASRADDCCELCHKKNGCGAYSWSNQDGGTCWLKSEKGSAKNNQGVRSGVVNKSQPESLKKFLKIVFSNESKTPVVHFNKSNKAKNHEDQETGKTVRVHINIHRKSH